MDKYHVNKALYEYWGQWRQPVLSAWFWVEWNKTRSLKDVNIYGVDIMPLLILDGHFFVSSSLRRDVLRMVHAMFKENRIEEYAVLLNQTFQKYEQEYLAVLKLPSSDPYLYIKGLFTASENITSIWSLIHFVGEVVTKVILEEMIVTNESELMDRTYRITRQTWLEKQSTEVTTFAKKIKAHNEEQISEAVLEKYPELRKEIDDHVKEFSWFGTHHWMGEGYTMAKCLEQINEVIKSPHHITLDKVNNDSEHPAIKLMATATYWRTHSAEIMAKVVYESRPIMEKIGALASLSYDELLYVSGPELLSITKDTNAQALKQKIIERKENGYGCVVTDKMEIVTGEVLKSLLGQMLTIHTGDVKEFKGSIASKGGLVKGIARVILSPSDFDKLQEGEILIAPETTPDYVPLMKKAAAIITDVGGITSHAAIVSRELRKPCIIGTKVATQAIKDGDLIEVDTEKGIVKIIN